MGWFDWAGDAIEWTGDQLGLGGKPKKPGAPKIDRQDYYLGAEGTSDALFADARRQSSTLSGRTAPSITASQANFAPTNYVLDQSSDAVRSGSYNANQFQQGLMQQLNERAMGRGGPSAAELAMRQQSQEAARQQLAMAATSGNPASMIAAQNNNAMAQGQLQQQLGIQRAQEIDAARAQLGGVTQMSQEAAQRTAGLDLARAQQMAGLTQYNTDQQQAAALANQAAGLQQMQMNDAASQYYYGTSIDVLQRQADLLNQYNAGLNNQFQTNMGAYGVDVQDQTARFGATTGALGAAVKGGG